MSVGVAQLRLKYVKHDLQSSDDGSRNELIISLMGVFGAYTRHTFEHLNQQFPALSESDSSSAVDEHFQWKPFKGQSAQHRPPFRSKATMNHWLRTL